MIYKISFSADTIYCHGGRVAVILISFTRFAVI